MDFLQRVIEMDKAAVARVEAFAEEQRKNSDESGEETERILKELSVEHTKKLAEYKAQQEEKLRERLASSEKEQADRIADLDRIFDAHKKEWESEILSRITGV